MSADTMPFLCKLDRFLPFTDHARAMLHAAVMDVSRVEAGVHLVAQDLPYRHAFVLHKGWALRTRLMPDGERQIVNFLLPGDAFGLAGAFFAKADHTITALTPVAVSRLNPDLVFKFITENPQFGAALFWSIALEESQLRERIVGLGRRSAEERVAHCLVDLQERLARVELGHLVAEGYPLTQQHVADAMGLSLVHVNRTLRALAKRGVIRLAPGRLFVTDPERLAGIAKFDDSYLHRDNNLSAMVRRQSDTTQAAAE